MCPPLYEYQCPKCHKVISELRNLNEKNTNVAEDSCSDCHGCMYKILSPTFGKVTNSKNPVKFNSKK